MILKFQGTDRMADSFNGILNRMCKIIHRVDAPGVTCSVMRHMCHTVDDRVTHIDIRRCHINFRTQNLFSILKFSVLHILKEC